MGSVEKLTNCLLSDKLNTDSNENLSCYRCMNIKNPTYNCKLHVRIKIFRSKLWALFTSNDTRVSNSQQVSSLGFFKIVWIIILNNNNL